MQYKHLNLVFLYFYIFKYDKFYANIIFFKPKIFFQVNFRSGSSSGSRTGSEIQFRFQFRFQNRNRNWNRNWIFAVSYDFQLIINFWTFSDVFWRKKFLEPEPDLMAWNRNRNWNRLNRNHRSKWRQLTSIDWRRSIFIITFYRKTRISQITSYLKAWQWRIWNITNLSYYFYSMLDIDYKKRSDVKFDVNFIDVAPIFYCSCAIVLKNFLKFAIFQILHCQAFK